MDTNNTKKNRVPLGTFRKGMRGVGRTLMKKKMISKWGWLAWPNKKVDYHD